MNSDGVVSEGQAVGAGGGADHIRTATAQPGQDEGNQKDLQVCHSLERHMPLLTDHSVTSNCVPWRAESKLNYRLFHILVPCLK